MEKQFELRKLLDRFFVFYDFIESKNQISPPFQDLKSTIQEAFDQRNLKLLREFNKELDVWLIEMFKPEEKEELKRLLKEKMGEDVEKSDRKRLLKIERIKAKGKVTTLNEYNLIQNRINEISNINEFQYEIKMLDKLLIGFYV